MKERPILFSEPMVLALLNGEKTQTRRIVKNPDETGCLTGDCPHDRQDGCNAALESLCPYGLTGDRLWVREAHRRGHDSISGSVQYRADGHVRPGLGDLDFERWRPSIHMPKDACRIKLEITGVRVQRLQEISQEDALAEGVQAWMKWREKNAEPFYEPDAQLAAYPTTAFARLWNSINEARGVGWGTNCWVWAVTFRRI